MSRVQPWKAKKKRVSSHLGNMGKRAQRKKHHFPLQDKKLCKKCIANVRCKLKYEVVCFLSMMFKVIDSILSWQKNIIFYKFYWRDSSFTRLCNFWRTTKWFSDTCTHIHSLSDSLPTNIFSGKWVMTLTHKKRLHSEHTIWMGILLAVMM